MSALNAINLSSPCGSASPVKFTYNPVFAAGIICSSLTYYNSN